MTRRQTVLAALTLATAAFSLGQPAAAGGGVRLNFGGPLGTFVATPTPGYGGGSGYANAKPKAYAKRAPVDSVQRKKTKPPRQVVQVRHSAPSFAPRATPVTTNEGTAPGLLGRTLAIDHLPRLETVRILAPTETVVVREAVNLPGAGGPAVTPSAKVAATPGPVTCRKFIPAVGVTVTVACD
jgi:hypothetical protein